MNTQTIGYKAKGFEPRRLAILFLIASVFPMLFFMPFILRILPWPEGQGPSLGGKLVLLFMVLLYTAPLTVPVILTAITEGKPGVKALMGRLWKGRLSIKWLLIATLLWPAIFLVINLLARTLEGDAPYPFRFIGQPWTYFPNAFLGVLLIAIFEEFCWRGYALPRLQAGWNALTSSLILGVFWALMHLPNWFMPPGDPIRTDSFMNFAVQIILTSILYTWIFNNTNGNLLGVILAHNMSNVVGTLIQVPDTYQTYQNWVLLAVVVFVVIFFGPKNLVRHEVEKQSEKRSPLKEQLALETPLEITRE